MLTGNPLEGMTGIMRDGFTKLGEDIVETVMEGLTQNLDSTINNLQEFQKSSMYKAMLKIVQSKMFAKQSPTFDSHESPSLSWLFQFLGDHIPAPSRPLPDLTNRQLLYQKLCETENSPSRSIRPPLSLASGSGVGTLRISVNEAACLCFKTWRSSSQAKIRNSLRFKLVVRLGADVRETICKKLVSTEEVNALVENKPAEGDDLGNNPSTAAGMARKWVNFGNYLTPKSSTVRHRIVFEEEEGVFEFGNIQNIWQDCVIELFFRKSANDDETKQSELEELNASKSPAKPPPASGRVFGLNFLRDKSGAENAPGGKIEIEVDKKKKIENEKAIWFKYGQITLPLSAMLSSPEYLRASKNDGKQKSSRSENMKNLSPGKETAWLRRRKPPPPAFSPGWRHLKPKLHVRSVNKNAESRSESNSPERRFHTTPRRPTFAKTIFEDEFSNPDLFPSPAALYETGAGKQSKKDSAGGSDTPPGLASEGLSFSMDDEFNMMSWFHIYPPQQNEYLYFNKYCKTTPGYPAYGMTNPISSLGLLSISVSFQFNCIPFLAPLRNNLIPPSEVWGLPIPFEPQIFEMAGYRVHHQLCHIPKWVRRFCHLLPNPNLKHSGVLPVSRTNYDFILIISFWMALVYMAVFAPLHHMPMLMAFLITLVSMSYKIQNDASGGAVDGVHYATPLPKMSRAQMRSLYSSLPAVTAPNSDKSLLSTYGGRLHGNAGLNKWLESVLYLGVPRVPRHVRKRFIGPPDLSTSRTKIRRIGDLQRKDTPELQKEFSNQMLPADSQPVRHPSGDGELEKESQVEKKVSGKNAPFLRSLSVNFNKIQSQIGPKPPESTYSSSSMSQEDSSVPDLDLDGAKAKSTPGFQGDLPTELPARTDSQLDYLSPEGNIEREFGVRPTFGPLPLIVASVLSPNVLSKVSVLGTPFGRAEICVRDPSSYCPSFPLFADDAGESDLNSMRHLGLLMLECVQLSLSTLALTMEKLQFAFDWTDPFMTVVSLSVVIMLAVNFTLAAIAISWIPLPFIRAVPLVMFVCACICTDAFVLQKCGLGKRLDHLLLQLPMLWPDSHILLRVSQNVWDLLYVQGVLTSAEKEERKSLLMNLMNKMESNGTQPEDNKSNPKSSSASPTSDSAPQKSDSQFSKWMKTGAPEPTPVSPVSPVSTNRPGAPSHPFSNWMRSNIYKTFGLPSHGDVGTDGSDIKETPAEPLSPSKSLKVSETLLPQSSGVSIGAVSSSLLLQEQQSGLFCPAPNHQYHTSWQKPDGKLYWRIWNWGWRHVGSPVAKGCFKILSTTINWVVLTPTLWCSRYIVYWFLRLPDRREIEHRQIAASQYLGSDLAAFTKGAEGFILSPDMPSDGSFIDEYYDSVFRMVQTNSSSFVHRSKRSEPSSSRVEGDVGGSTTRTFGDGGGLSGLGSAWRKMNAICDPKYGTDEAGGFWESGVGDGVSFSKTINSCGSEWSTEMLPEYNMRKNPDMVLKKNKNQQRAFNNEAAASSKHVEKISDVDLITDKDETSGEDRNNILDDGKITRVPSSSSSAAGSVSSVGQSSSRFANGSIVNRFDELKKGFQEWGETKVTELAEGSIQALFGPDILSTKKTT